MATQLDMKRISAVPHTNTVFRDILKLVAWSEFDKLVKNHGSDELARRFTRTDPVHNGTLDFDAIGRNTHRTGLWHWSHFLIGELGVFEKRTKKEALVVLARVGWPVRPPP